MHELMTQVAGVIKLIEFFELEVIAVKANASGAQVQINAALPDYLQESVTEETSAGQNLFGVWVIWKTDQ